MFGAFAVFVARSSALRQATSATYLGFVLAASVVSTQLVAGLGGSQWASEVPRWPSLGIRLDIVTAVMLSLVCALGLVIARYSQTYLHGDLGQRRYARWFLATLSAVTLLVISNNLLVIALAWTATSLALHQLLTFYSHRTPALVAAHKKFLVSRLADVCLLGGTALVGLSVGSVQLDAIANWVRLHEALPTSLELAAVLIVVAVSLKSAQLPFHGWLIQVMEAPTPVSALLHAGVVNIGGFVLIRLAPFMAHAAMAQTLLVGTGMLTTVLAALVMTTRVSVKVSLAWSTCAQTGFMLAQCGLGLWHLALLHLVAHSLYKAHAFLSSGGTVNGWRVHSISKKSQALSPSRLVTIGGFCVLSVLGALAALGLITRDDLSLTPLAFVVGLSLVPLASVGLGQGARQFARVALRCVGVLVLYFGWHAVFGLLLPLPAGSAASWPRWSLVVLGFTTLFVLQTALQTRPRGRLARALYPRLFAGFYLDERFTRLTFRLWPLRKATAQPQYVDQTLEAR